MYYCIYVLSAVLLYFRCAALLSFIIFKCMMKVYKCSFWRINQLFAVAVWLSCTEEWCEFLAHADDDGGTVGPHGHVEGLQPVGDLHVPDGRADLDACACACRYLHAHRGPYTSCTLSFSILIICKHMTHFPNLLRRLCSYGSGASFPF